MGLQAVNFLVFLLGEVGSGGAHCKIDVLTLLNMKLIGALSTFGRCQDSGEGGGGDWYWLFTREQFRCRLPVSPPGGRTDTSGSAPNLESPSIGTPGLLGESLSISKCLCPFKRLSTPIRR